MNAPFLGRYHLVEKIGSGGMGVVYRARDERLSREVAVKVLTPGLLTDESARKRFRQEATLISRLNHPNIETIHDFDTQEGVDFLVLEYIPGESLDVRVARGPLEEKEVLKLGLQLARGLSAAHGKGLVHRDLKPGNLRVTPEGQLKILDFGLAKLLTPTPEAGTPLTTTVELLSREGMVVGTLPYMAPEQLRGEAVDGRTDVYGAGVVLYELATGKRPFGGENQAVLINAILNQAPDPPSGVNKRVGSSLEYVILKALEREPALRYQTATELGVDLERLTVHAGFRPAPKTKPRRRPVPGAAWGIAIGGILMSLVLLCHPERGEALNSIAVLPFENASGDPDLEYLSDGIAESLTNTLSQLPSLKKVIAWGSMRQIRDQIKEHGLDPTTAGRKLDVRAILLGRVLNRGQALEVKAELMRVKDSQHVWGDEYRGNMADLLAMEDSLADEISESLRLQLSQSDNDALAKRNTRDPEAYQLYLKGKYHSFKWSREDPTKAIQYFEQAIARDPGYGLAYAGLADALYGINNIWKPPREIMPKMKAASLRAIELDPTLAEAYTSLAMVKHLYEFDWVGAEGDFKHAIAINPGCASCRLYYGNYLTMLGRFNEAQPLLDRARELDPFSDFPQGLAMYPAFYTGNYGRAVTYLRRWLESNPPSPYPNQLLGEAYEFNGQLEDALAELQRSLDKGAYPWTQAAKARVLVKLGRKDEARMILGQLEDLSKTDFVTPYAVATVYAELGEKDTAFAFLEKAYADRTEDLGFLKIDPRMDTLRADPRFADLLRRVGLGP